MYLVIEVCDREAALCRPAETRGEASRIANELLEEHCRTADRSDVYDAYTGPRPPKDWPPKLHLDAPEDGEMGAWANLNGLHWDAHIMYVPDDTAAAMLGMLLKVLCKAETLRPDGRCGDGACDGCPVTDALAMLERALGKERGGDDTEGDDDGKTERDNDKTAHG